MAGLGLAATIAVLVLTGIGAQLGWRLPAPSQLIRVIRNNGQS
ncbi:putative membrane protein [Mycolicibacterium hassiacum DSM 44199]|jgi:hypothetical protein|uniref:Putative membrane protein n=1 Tax=Mycolicibacterium hassiacum (strain DSM 44199 / CIP 105218 / JCM 12690 / 3849) TaxID=1122247 RepID=K5BFE9_MYCHD|nr:hypothetical protein [Mycolicibacterium hassiacum]EKF23822.1 putative membrane protein [Mycolicibacterium hassiacum DSM 44199]MDA4085878.1 hypothetical protein [Mycolicibacterium hassiacum DSM 44199]VCT90383.1 hypothetical protein MHAS_02088 [Mycolicibacterium hassiacum DSM 44199]